MDNHLQEAGENQKRLEDAFKYADNVVMHKYMPDISGYSIKPASNELKNTNINNVLRLNKIKKIVYNAEENNLDKLMNVYNSVALCGGSIIQIIYSDGYKIEYYIGTRANNINEMATCQSVLTGTFEGNFPGSRIEKQDKKELMSCIERIFSGKTGEHGRVISAVSGIPGFHNEDSKEFVQGMEKLIDSMGNKEYALVTIAEPVDSNKLSNIKETYENLYSQISPFAKTSQTYSESDSDALAKSITSAITESTGNTVNESTNHSTSHSDSVSSGKNWSIGFGFGLLQKGISPNISFNKGKSSSVSEQNGTSYGTSYGTSESKTYSSSKTEGDTSTYTTTSGKSMQLTYENKKVTGLMKQLEKQIERIDTARDTGLWRTATYCITDDVQTNRTLASTFQSLCRGKKSTIESYSINTWTNPYKLKSIEEYLKNMAHPCFETDFNDQILNIRPASLISGRELVISAGLPQKSINGVHVSKMVSFARNIIIEGEDTKERESINIGNIYHMGNIENTKVNLDLESLSAHVLVTGSTGAGKSNTVYSLISGMREKGIKFLIIEPAKGEYKNVFGNDNDVQVFGTNSRWSKLLKINPFSFPDNIHILEHVDRLIEIFNVCWPMYAAMPAVLKDAILQAYKRCGWNLELSVNIYGKKYYPSFKDLQKQIVQVINSSAYSEEVRGNYIGSLATRVNSLANGINGQMFTNDGIDEKILFDSNIIADLSRAGSQETKSLVMGLLVMKLNEYRMSQANGRMNQKLKHVTILEEAHNLLRNTNGKQISSEGGDMAGKSVEMLSGSIAEMRTYGEGFIIVDQSPNAIDISAIRNTNTKIIMRLPEESDRKQAGRSAALSDKQIPELAKLPKGVAVIYQNNWLDPVLCKINKADINEREYIYNPQIQVSEVNEKDIKKMIVMLLVGNRVDESLDIQTDLIRNNIEKVNIPTESKIAIENTIVSLEEGNNPAFFHEESFEELSNIVCEVLDYGSFKFLIDFIEDEKEIQLKINHLLQDIIGNISKELELAVSQCILRKLVTENKDKIELYTRWREFAVLQRKQVL